MLTFQGTAVMLEKRMQWSFYDYGKKKTDRDSGR